MPAAPDVTASCDGNKARPLPYGRALLPSQGSSPSVCVQIPRRRPTVPAAGPTFLVSDVAILYMQCPGYLALALGPGRWSPCHFAGFRWLVQGYGMLRLNGERGRGGVRLMACPWC